jgi:hypothetical protein
MSYYGVGLPEVWNTTLRRLPAAGLHRTGERFNGLLTGIYTAAGDPVADVQSAFQVNDTTLVDRTPLDVLRECQWTWICAPPPHGPDIHANSDGYSVIAQAFENVLP